MQSKAYEEGFRSGIVYNNPYHESTPEFDDFERGWVQRIKRMPDSCFNASSRQYQPPSFKDKYASWGQVDNDNAQSEPLSGYARAKNK
ncbi:hypothetical protein [Photobacterium profundum]|uniref:hypothetical protein n=1 Tax=Photobacterium profundum TaxID=74109 RepID=UPI00059B6626|nr:hypothetical protein [Photobacterium profundum]